MIHRRVNTEPTPLFQSAVEDSLTTTTRISEPSKIEKFTRLPVWPVWQGVLLWMIEKLTGGPSLSAKLEDALGGRVCPMVLSDFSSSSPFVLAVHHCHSFAWWDPIRYLQRQLILPEGFPSHPHRGFVTLTYILKGGMVHRDSLGVKQVYEQSQAQWLDTGAGVLHEEMFTTNSTRQELYQIWVNLPANCKFRSPSTKVMQDLPVLTDQPNCLTTVVVGMMNTNVMAEADEEGIIELDTPLAVLHVQMEANAQWKWPEDLMEPMATNVIYVRRGSLVNVPVHSTACFNDLKLLEAGHEGADILVMSGDPIREPSVVQGSFVLNSSWQIQEAYQDYQAGKFGKPWDHRLTDDEWREHVQAHPSAYRAKH